MANYNTSATVTLTVNGKQAQQMLKRLQEEAKTLETKIAAAAKAGDKAFMAKYQKELRSVNSQIKQLQNSAKNVEQVLRALDRATPRELNKTLRTLQSQLNGIERGSKAWDAQTAKIKQVKEELRKVNEELQPQESWWDQFNDWLNNCQTALLGLGAAVTGLVMAGKAAVQAYADMEQEMANVQKFTGMNAEEVSALNEELKKIDTRTSREDLNKLAQEAGRLGKTSQEDVLGFVRAADKINVALDDLGEGATLTLSKLTGIFGDEKRLGTEKALLSVGSVINELSQNCAASAPYIAEFASRMGGVGSQAGMTVQQIMGYAAVLDSNNQKLEASATALSQVIVRIYQDPAKYAQVAGIDVQRFSSLVKTDMNEALVLLLSTLKEAGSMDVLSPMFKDMGENGSRAISALSTLAGHIQEVKDQQAVANEAFEQAVSIDKEFEVQNNTVQAGLDKAKNRFNELAVELGEKLQPVMRYCISSSSAMLRALKAIVDFFIEYRREILALALAITAYTLTVKGAAIGTALWSVATKAAHAAAVLGKVAVTALKIAYFQLTGNVNRAAAATRVFNSVCKASPLGLLLGLITAVVGGLVAYITRTNEAKRATEEARKEQEEWRKGLSDLSQQSAEYASNETARLKTLYDCAVNEAKSKDERRAAAERLQALYPDYFKNMSVEEIMVGRAIGKYNELRKSIIETARARAAEEKVYENEKERNTISDTHDQNLAKESAAQKRYDAALAAQRKAEREHRPALNAEAIGDAREVNSSVHLKAINAANARVAATRKALDAAKATSAATKKQLEDIDAANQHLIEKYHLEPKIAEGTPETAPFVPSPSSVPEGGGSGSGAAPDRFAAEKDWREQAEASARIAYATGETDYLAYTKKMDEIAVAFYEKQLLHTDLTETERLTITAQWREAQKKQTEDGLSATAEAENASYSQRLAEAKQFYLDGKYSKETYDEAVERLEIEHLQALAKIYAEGSKERLDADRQLQDALIQQMQRRQAKQKELERKFASMKEKFFGDNPAEKQAKYDVDFALLKSVYDKELAAAGSNASEKLRIEEAFEKAKLALKTQYGLQGEEDNRNAMQKGVAKSVEWLESDGGKAVTGAMSTISSGMSAMFSGLSTLVQAELEMQTAAIEKRYEREISLAEGNTYQVKKLEKQKQKEIAKAKNQANRKMFAMQVIQAVAQTAQNAISAYGSAAAIPIVGYLLAPIAAGMAVAAGMIQIAAIKKQQQASEAQGYSSGGFTPSGRRDQAVGIVHAGEWVASQKLVGNPQVRPLLQALDYAQRTNTVGSLRAEDVSRSIMAPVALSQLSSLPPQVVVQAPSVDPESTKNSEKLNKSLDLLNSRLSDLGVRLDEPFAAITTITGDHGIQKAQEDYDRLMKNKSPKSRR